MLSALFSQVVVGVRIETVRWSLIFQFVLRKNCLLCQKAQCIILPNFILIFLNKSENNTD